MKDLGEEYNMVITEKLMLSSAFGSTLFVQPELSLGTTGLQFQMQNF